MTIRARMDDSPTTCVVADDHPAVVEAVCALLATAGIVIVAKAHNGDTALRAIQELRPTTAVVDVAMPKLGGIEVARAARLTTPETGTILYTGHTDLELLVEALDAGARGFVLKEGPLLDLIRAVEQVAAGETYVDPTLAPMLLRATAGKPHPKLSVRERQILGLLAEGKSNDDIAQALEISPDTVRTYLRRAMQKLEADTRTQAVAIAVRQSLIS